MKTQTQFKQIQHLKSLSAIINFCITLFGNEIKPSTRFKMARFKVGYQMVKLNDYSNNKSIDELTSLGNSIIKNYE